jgi:archaetidylinositol phosphate synthase
MNDIRNHQRVNDSLLGPLERPVLKWLALHLPAWVTPDGCTFVGIIGALAAMAGYALSCIDRNFLWLASLGFALNWLGDSLDGTLARHRNIERPVIGFFIDHTTDAASQVVIFLGLGLSPYVSFPVATLALVAYMLLSVLVYIRTYATGEFTISYGKFGPTEIRVLAIGMNTVMYFAGIREIRLAVGAAGSLALNPYDLAVAAVTIVLLLFFTATVVREIIRMRKTNR